MPDPRTFIKGRINAVGKAWEEEDGRPATDGWAFTGGRGGFNASASGPDDPLLCGWTFRELHAIANGVGGDAPTISETWRPQVQEPLVDLSVSDA